MDVFLIVRRKKTNIFLEAKENTKVLELKKIIQGILKVSPENQKLMKDELMMDESKLLSDYGLLFHSARAQNPAVIGLAFRDDVTGEFEPLEVCPLSVPPELPDVMKHPQPDGHSEREVSNGMNN
jgi:transcription elongation factor B subunit 2